MNEKTNTTEKHDANRDPLSGAPGAHPVGTGLGAAAGGAATGAAIGAVAGPIGAAIGIVAGAVAGGLAGKGVAEKVDPTVEDSYWRENYSKRGYVKPGSKYEAYQPAYRVGYEGRSRYAGKRFDDVEADLRKEYERSAEANAIGWDHARNATRDAWDRFDQTGPGMGKSN